jgi:hypothetical protein
MNVPPPADWQPAAMPPAPSRVPWALPLLCGIVALVVAFGALAVAVAGHGRGSTAVAAPSTSTTAPPQSTTPATTPVTVPASASASASTSVAAGPASMSKNSAHPPAADVQVSSCTLDGQGEAHATGTIVNHSSQESDYVVAVAFVDAHGTKLDDGADAVAKVEPGAQATWHGLGLVDLPAGSPITCSLTDVERVATLGG